jgi:tetratricopeptide (TPR) repeat protein
MDLVMKRIECYTFVAAAVFIYLAAESAYAQDTPVTDCDTYAASDLDPQRKSAGLAFDKINPGLAVPACEAAVQQYSDSSRLIYQLGRAYHKADKFGAAAAQYRKAAELGNSSAQVNLGTMYVHGQGVPQDYAEATKWFRKAADQGNAVAQHYLADLTGHLTAVETASLSLAEIKARAVGLTYDQMARTPSTYAGQIINLRGKVTQVIETGTAEVQLRVDVTPGEYLWKDTIYVDYTRASPSEPRILENDIIEFFDRNLL